MDATPQTDFQDSSDTAHSVPQNEVPNIPCSACRDLNANHGPRSVLLPECLLKGCYVCADIVKINKEISSTYERLSGLFEEQKKLMEKPRYMYDTIINCMPVEILSAIFVSIKDTVFGDNFKKRANYVVTEPTYKQPSQSPPLYLGAVCKRWRDVTLATPQLWTDITVNLTKSTEGQTNMVENWGSRSGALPLDITIFPEKSHDLGHNLNKISSAVRSLAVRWNNIALRVPASFCHELLYELKETPNINSFFVPDVIGNLGKIKLQNPLRPRVLFSRKSYLRKIPFKWDRLESVNISEDLFERRTLNNPNPNDDGDAQIFDILLHAPKLRHCMAFGGGVTTPPAFITNRSLTYLITRGNALRHLTLPSLSTLRYIPLRNTIDEQTIDTVVEFIDRSRAPLKTFAFAGCIPRRPPFPSLHRLSCITTLSISGDPDPVGFHDFLVALARPAPDGILPRLKEFDFVLSVLSASLWLRVCDLFRKVPQPNAAIGGPSVVFRRPFSKVKITLESCRFVAKDVYLHLLDAKNSGANLTINVMNQNWFEVMAEDHGV